MMTTPWQPIKPPPAMQAVPYSAVNENGGTFWMDGEFFRKFPSGGYRRQMGRAPKQLKTMSPDTIVFI